MARNPRQMLAWPLALALAGCGADRATEPEADGAGVPVSQVFADTALAGAVRQALGGAAPGSQTLQALTSLTATDRGIADLRGIEALAGLTRLDLRGNAIADLGPLRALTRLEHLDLAGNAVVDLSPLSTLARLQVVILRGNPVVEVGALLGLEWLDVVDLVAAPLSVLGLRQAADLAARGVEVATGPAPDAGGAPAEPSGPRLDFRLLYPGTSANNLTDLWLAPADGRAEAVNVTQAPMRYEQLALSPDGRRVAYVADREVRDYWHLWVMGVDGSGLIKVNEEAVGPSRFAQLAWAPDGTRLALSRYFSLPSQGKYYSEIHLADPSRRAVEAVTAEARSGVFHFAPTWSPDGRRLACLRSHGPASAVHIHDLATGRADSLLLDGLASDLRWSPTAPDRLLAVLSGAGTLVVYGAPGSVIQPAHARIWLLDPASGLALPLTAHDGSDWQPAWSPDGARIAYVSTRDAAGGQLFVMDADGTGVTNLTPDLDLVGLPTWSPDGRWVVFARRDPQTYDSQLWAAPVDGSGPVPLAAATPQYRYGTFAVVPGP